MRSFFAAKRWELQKWYQFASKLWRANCREKNAKENLQEKYCQQFAALRLPWDVKHVRYLSVSRNSRSFTFYNFSSHKTSTNLRLDFRPVMDDFSCWQMWRFSIPVILVWRGKESFLNFGEILSGANLLKRDAALGKQTNSESATLHIYLCNAMCTYIRMKPHTL